MKTSKTYAGSSSSRRRVVTKTEGDRGLVPTQRNGRELKGNTEMWLVVFCFVFSSSFGLPAQPPGLLLVKHHEESSAKHFRPIRIHSD